MKAQVFFRKIVLSLALLAALLIFAWIDWLPTLKDLNRLKREEREYSLQTKRLKSLISHFVFPDKSERLIFFKTANQLLESLPKVADDASWLAMIVSALRDLAKQDQVDSALLFPLTGPGLPAAAPLNLSDRTAMEDLQRWLAGQRQETDHGLQTFADFRQFPWHAVFAGPEFDGKWQLACRPIGIAVAAKLPALLNFVNHCSWLAGRLEIVQLHMSRGENRPLAMIFCRGYYRVDAQSAWPIMAAAGEDNEHLLVDPDSELLWQPVDPKVAGLTTKNELPPLRDRGLFMRKKN